MLYVTGDYAVVQREGFEMGVTTLVTLQSGCWETVPIGHYTVPALTGEEFSVDLYFGMNNYRMPTFFRWDAGQWKQISLLPILPSISYRVEF